MSLPPNGGGCQSCSRRFAFRGCETEFFELGQKRVFHAQSGTGVPHSKTLRVPRAPPICRQVLECGRASAALPLAHAFLYENTYIRITNFRAEASASKNSVSHPRSGGGSGVKNRSCRRWEGKGGRRNGEGCGGCGRRVPDGGASGASFRGAGPGAGRCGPPR